MTRAAKLHERCRITETQQNALQTLAENGGSCVVRRSTAVALERLGLVTASVPWDSTSGEPTRARITPAGLAVLASRGER